MTGGFEKMSIKCYAQMNDVDDKHLSGHQKRKTETPCKCKKGGRRDQNWGKRQKHRWMDYETVI